MLGTVCGSWQMARAASQARSCLERGRGDVAYLQGVIDLARFYFGHMAPQAVSLSRVVMHGSRAAVDACDAAFG